MLYALLARRVRLRPRPLDNARSEALVPVPQAHDLALRDCRDGLGEANAHAGVSFATPDILTGPRPVALSRAQAACDA